LNGLWNLGLTPAGLEELALELGSDVPYCVRGGTVAAIGRGEIMTTLDPIPETWFVLVHPPIRASTAEVFSGLRLETGSDQVSGEFSPRLREAIQSLGSGSLPECTFNCMEPLVFGKHPVLADIKVRLLKAGCPAAAMSGSGPTMFGLCTSQAHAQQVPEHFADFQTSVVSSVSFGVAHCSDSGESR
jgi:4-diphosphocytidyl-2-C-methyl-D-erythritol kinase